MGTFALAHRGRDTEQTTDTDLVAAVRRGEDTAFEELFRRYHQRVTGYVTRMVGCREHAEEIAQEAFISALRRLRETEQAITFKAWIYGIARNGAIDHLRARSRRAPEVGYDHVEEFVEPAGTPGAPAPEAAMESKQSLADLQGAFGSLSETHHQILVMRELEGLSYDQLGERLSMSRSQVESTLFRARRRLEEEYSELVSGERCRRVQELIGREDDALGIRDARRVERHLSHCHPCRRSARKSRLTALAA
ncbi:MAG: sigma-70 family polymerase sigma factor [Solirubrobacterales bacterium]|jgi:RNA polymerase sigma factor (sigma-70 family)|nr:sigma-70 family polymerase sigma factor [Solirubrobacterales bacterium]